MRYIFAIIFGCHDDEDNNDDNDDEAVAFVCSCVTEPEIERMGMKLPLGMRNRG